MFREVLAGLEFQVSVTQGSGRPPRLNVYAVKPSGDPGDPMVFGLELSRAQTAQLNHRLFDALEMIESEEAQAARATRQ